MKNSLKVGKFLSFFHEVVKGFSDFRLKCKEIDDKYLKSKSCYPIFILRLTSCLPSCYDFPKSEAQLDQNGVAYKRMCKI